MHRRTGIYFAVLQLFFTLSWTVYVIFLPRLAAQAGIAKDWVLWILLADQVVFLAVDWAMGMYADRAARVVGRLGTRLALVTLMSSIAFLLLPWIAPMGSPALLLGLTFVWAASSSALRAPPLALIGKYASVDAKPWLSSLWLLGIGVAAAVAPYLTAALRDADPRLPFALSTVAVAATAWALGWAERQLRSTAPDRAAPAAPSRVSLVAFLFVVALAGIGLQVHFSMNSARQYLRFASPADLEHLMPVFWVGFNLCVLPLTLAIRRIGSVHVLALGVVVASVAALAAVVSGGLAELVTAQFAAGAAWAAVMFGAFGAAMAIGHSGREGQATGAMFSVFAAAAALRIVFTAIPDVRGAAALAWIPAGAWALAALVLLIALASRAPHPVERNSS